MLYICHSPCVHNYNAFVFMNDATSVIHFT